MSKRKIQHFHHSINYDFLLPGHTKFAPDWCFGLVKQKTRRTFIPSLFDIARTVEDSASVNVAQLVGLHNGTVLVETYDWTTYLGQYFKKLPHIKTFHHFRFDKDYPGTVFCKQYWESEERAVQGISRERAEYLFKEIREFCREGTEDVVAPEGTFWNRIIVFLPYV